MTKTLNTQEAHNAMGDYAIWQGVAHPRAHRRVRTVMRHGESLKIVETETPSFSISHVHACRNLFVTRVRALLDAGDEDEQSSVDALRQTWLAQGFAPEVIEQVIAAYHVEEEALAALIRAYEGEVADEPLII